jgi:ribonuclease D
MSASLPAPTLVTDQAGLTAMLEALEGARVIGVDTEADAFFSYHQKVCLVQVTAGEQDWIVDPLADLDLAPMGPMLADPERVKVFHDAEFDILLLGRSHGFRLAGLFDTRVAAAVLGSTNPGLANVLEARFGVTLDKSMQRSDWSKRPLSDKQLDYARMDTRLLPRLFEELLAECTERGRLEIVESECRRLEALEPADEAEVHPDAFVKIKGARELDPVGRAVLRELFLMRDEAARAADRPPFRILGNGTLIDLARRRPRSTRELTAIKGFTPRVASKLGARTQEAIRRGLEAEPLKRLPNPPRKDGAVDMDEATQELHERLKRWRKEAAEELGLESAYLVNRHLLARLALDRPRDADALARVEGIQDWQLRDHGARIIEVVRRFAEDEAADRLPKKRRSWRR